MVQQRAETMDGGLYDSDFLTWTQQQAAALRRLSERADNFGLDLVNLVEEVETLGRAELARVQGALFRLLEHAALVALAGPGHRDVPHWRGEMVAFRWPAAKNFRPSMRQHLEPELASLWHAARQAATRKFGRDPDALPEALPFTLDQLLRDLPLDDLPPMLAPPAGP